MEDRHWPTGKTLALGGIRKTAFHIRVTRASTAGQHGSPGMRRADGERQGYAAVHLRRGLLVGFGLPGIPAWFWSVRGRKGHGWKSAQEVREIHTTRHRVRLAFGPLRCALTFPRGSCLSFPIHVTDTCLPVRLRRRTYLGACTHHHGTA